MIDRRIFLQLTGGAAAGTAGFAVSTDAAVGAAMPDRATHAVAVIDGVISPLADPLKLLSEKLALATRGRLALHSASGTADWFNADRLVLAGEDEFADREPTSLLLGGSPFDPSSALLDASTWLRAMGGQALWDEVAARAGWKPLLIASLTRDDVQVWSRLPLSRPADLAGLRIAASPVLSAALRQIGAAPTAVRSSELLSAFKSGEIDVFETADPAISMSMAQEAAGRAHWYFGNLAGTHRVLSLRIPLTLWDGLPISDRAIIEAVAADTSATLDAVRRAHLPVLLGAIRRTCDRRGPAVTTSIRLELAAQTVKQLDEMAARDPVFRNARASMSALVRLGLHTTAFDWEYEPA